MRCSKCGFELNDGEIYCSNCGASMQIVPDFNELEDELLPELLSEDSKREQVEKDILRAVGLSVDGNEVTVTHRFRRFLIFVFCILILIGIAAGVSYTRSDGYILKSAKRFDEKEEYEQAIAQYERLTKGKDSTEAYLAIVSDYEKLGDQKKVKEVLVKAIKDHPNEPKFYRKLLVIYDKEGNRNAIRALGERIRNPKIVSMIEEYVVHAPEFSVDGGSFDDDIELILTSPDDDDIYYTLDGSKPTKKKGEKYEEPILLKSGTTIVKACCIDRDGVSSDIEEKEYKITYLVPKMPVCTPKSGTYRQETMITITCEDPNASIFYSWNGATPTANAARYVEPIPMPEGNHVLSVVAINKEGVASGICRCNYVYLP